MKRKADCWIVYPKIGGLAEAVFTRHLDAAAETERLRALGFHEADYGICLLDTAGLKDDAPKPHQSLPIPERVLIAQTLQEAASRLGQATLAQMADDDPGRPGVKKKIEWMLQIAEYLQPSHAEVVEEITNRKLKDFPNKEK